MRHIAAVMVLGTALALSATDSASALDAKLEQVATGLTAPLLLVEPPDGSKRRFIIEQIGRIRILMPDGELLPQPFLDISHKLVKLHSIFDERGLLGLAFHPKYQENGRFFVAYSAPLHGHGDLGRQFWWSHTNVVAEYRVSADDPDRADDASERIVTRMDWPQFNHNGHWIGFGADGYLYLSTGDGGYANDWGIGHNVTKGNGQDLESLNGKILRLDVEGPSGYRAPDDNPFASRSDALPEIWAYGFRNPWRCAFDPGGDRELLCGDVGQNAYEEVNLVTKGGNYGWRVKEGNHCFDYANPNTHPESCDDAEMVAPIVAYKNCNVFQDDCKGISVTGGYVYRGHHVPWAGKYFFGDWSKAFMQKAGRLYVASRSSAAWSVEEIKVTNMPEFDAYVLAFGQDGDGEIYVMATDLLGPVGAGDRVYKLVP